MATPSNSSLYIYHLPKHCNDAELGQVFSTYGIILSVTIYKNQDKPFAVVIFANAEDADRARVQLNGCVFMGRKIRISKAPQPDAMNATQGSQTINSIYVRYSSQNVEKPITAADLQHYFSPFGLIEDVSIKVSSIDQRTGIQSGYAFVHFSSDDQGVQAAIQAVASMDCNHIDGIKFKAELSRNLLKQFEPGKEKSSASALGMQIASLSNGSMMPSPSYSSNSPGASPLSQTRSLQPGSYPLSFPPSTSYQQSSYQQSPSQSSMLQQQQLQPSSFHNPLDSKFDFNGQDRHGNRNVGLQAFRDPFNSTPLASLSGSLDGGGYNDSFVVPSPPTQYQQSYVRPPRPEFSPHAYATMQSPHASMLQPPSMSSHHPQLVYHTHQPIGPQSIPYQQQQPVQKPTQQLQHQRSSRMQANSVLSSLSALSGSFTPHGTHHTSFHTQTSPNPSLHSSSGSVGAVSTPHTTPRESPFSSPLSRDSDLSLRMLSIAEPPPGLASNSKESPTSLSQALYGRDLGIALGGQKAFSPWDQPSSQTAPRWEF